LGYLLLGRRATSEIEHQRIRHTINTTEAGGPPGPPPPPNARYTWGDFGDGGFGNGGESSGLELVANRAYTQNDDGVEAPLQRKLVSSLSCVSSVALLFLCAASAITSAMVLLLAQPPPVPAEALLADAALRKLLLVAAIVSGTVAIFAFFTHGVILAEGRHGSRRGDRPWSPHGHREISPFRYPEGIGRRSEIWDARCRGAGQLICTDDTGRRGGFWDGALQRL
jgi:hypothetical protein